MVSPEAQATPMMSRRDVSIQLMDVICGLFKRHGRVKRPFVSPRPKEWPQKFMSIMVSPLMNRRREDVGEVRVWLEVPKDEILDIVLRVEWTRNAFGFWYWQEYKIPNGEDPTSDLVKVLNSAIRPVKTTADGSVRVASMNRMFRKVKKNKVKDRAARIGLMMG